MLIIIKIVQFKVNNTIEIVPNLTRFFVLLLLSNFFGRNLRNAGIIFVSDGGGGLTEPVAILT